MSEANPSEKMNIRQVAAVAGVSHMTVSRVLNNHPNIRESTRRKVLDVIEELNYRPNLAARALVTQRSRRFGILIESSYEFGPSQTIRAVEDAARERGYSITSASLGGSQMEPIDAIDHLTAHGVDAICVIAPRSSSLTTLRKIHLNVPVLVIQATPDPAFLTVSGDQQQGTDLVVDHLMQLGHRDILHLAGPLDWLDARARERAFASRVKQWGAKERPIVVGDWSADFSYDFVMSMKRLPDYTAIFAANDSLALGLLHGFHDRGISVPNEISVVGFDDMPGAAHFIPPLTTVRQDFRALAIKSVEVLQAAAEGTAIPQRSKISMDLIVRSSTSVPREASAEMSGLSS
ncbi:LacI family DNA-binding transcriptional regulator [Timonella senegalensis]|uniref:LacI family DNA-binding transcriptional regulator n=3 Tax=Timonella senegalensis TaxID=1465825 RepID=UPI002FDE2B52